MSLQLPPYRADLQGLRAIAILLVVLSHTGLPIFPGGFVGVDVFFVLSGYLITGILLKEIEQKGRINLTRFYAHRIKRLLPAMITMLGISFFATFKFLSETEARTQLSSALYAATWTSNIYYTFTQLNYFDELATRDIFTHTWSLAVEEQFYLIWPALLLLLIRLNQMRNITTGLLIILATSFIASVFLTEKNPQIGFYLMPSRMWEFALGGIINTTLTNNTSKTHINHRIAWGLLSAGGLLIIISSITFKSNMAYPGALALIPAIGAALLIMAGESLDNKNPLAHPLLVWLGDRSYSLYLWHWPILVIGFSLGLQGNIVPTIGLAVLAVVFSMVSYRFIEQPFWKGRFSHATPKNVILIGLLTITIASAAFFHIFRIHQQENTNSMAYDLSNQWRMDFPVIYRMPCDAWYSHAKVEPCIFGDASAKKTVVLLGDSIGAQWFSLISGTFKQPEWRTIVLTKSSCPIVDEDFFYTRIGKTYHVCTEWRNATINTLKTINPDVLIIGNATTYDFSDEKWTNGTSRILKKIDGSAKTTIILLGTPSLGFDGPGCIARNISEGHKIDESACLAKNRLKESEKIKNNLKKSAEQFNNVHLIDLNDIVCPDGYCNAVSNQGIVTFRDSQHLTDSFVKSITPEASIRFRKTINGLE